MHEDAMLKALKEHDEVLEEWKAEYTALEKDMEEQEDEVSRYIYHF